MLNAQKYAKDKKYTKIEPLIKYKMTEISSLIFYFMSFDPLFDPFSAESVKINTDDLKEQSFLQIIIPMANNFPAKTN